MPVLSVRPLVSSDSTRFGGKFKKLPKKSVDLSNTNALSTEERDALRTQTAIVVRKTLLKSYPKHLQELAKPVHKQWAVTYGDVLEVLSDSHMLLHPIANKVGLPVDETRKALRHLIEMGLVEQPHVFKFLRRSAMIALHKMLHSPQEHYGLYNSSSEEKLDNRTFLHQFNDVLTGYRYNRYGSAAVDLWKKRTDPEIAPAFQPPLSLLQKLTHRSA